MTPSGIKPATIRPVAQCLKNCATVGPKLLSLLSFPLENGEFEKSCVDGEKGGSNSDEFKTKLL